MRHLALAVALACVLSGAVCAGEIHIPGAVAPPPPSTTSGETPGTAPGEVHTTVGPGESGTVLTIILTVISIVP